MALAVAARLKDFCFESGVVVGLFGSVFCFFPVESGSFGKEERSEPILGVDSEDGENGDAPTVLDFRNPGRLELFLLPDA